MMISILIINLMLVAWPIYLPMIVQEYDWPCITTGDALEKAIAHLEHCEFNGKVGLIRESPDKTTEGGSDAYWRYWLTTDNRVAQYALKAAGEDELASTLAVTLQTYGDRRHGIIEVLDGKDIVLPPLTEMQCRIATIGENTQVWYERRSGHQLMNDWDEYADLLLYGALDAYYHPETSEFDAVDLYVRAIAMFDGKGFADKFFCTDGRNLHPTYKLALALYMAQVLEQPIPKDLVDVLLAQQDSATGGFYTLYHTDGKAEGNTSTEPTAHAILALSASDDLPIQIDAVPAGQCTNSNPLPAHPRGTVR